jgi:hypothetical protein
MKIAELPDGRQLQFPADMDDAAMDAEVQRHLMGGQQPQAPAMDTTPEVLPLIMNALQNSAVTRKSEDQQRAAREQQMLESQQQGVQRIGQMLAQSQMEAAGSLADMFSQMTQDLGGSLNSIAQSSAQSAQIVQAVNNLADTILEVGKMLADILTTPRVISDDAQGNPRMIGPAGKKKQIN